VETSDALAALYTLLLDESRPAPITHEQPTTSSPDTAQRAGGGRALRASWTPFHRGVLAIYLIRTSD
jgi:hypothetical protein